MFPVCGALFVLVWFGFGFGNLPLGSPLHYPYCCLKIGWEEFGRGAIGVGISLTQFEPTIAPEAIGCDHNAFVLLAAARSTLQDSLPRIPGMVGASAGRMVTPILTTEVNPPQLASDGSGSGFYRPPIPVTQTRQSRQCRQSRNSRLFASASRSILLPILSDFGWMINRFV